MTVRDRIIASVQTIMRSRGFHEPSDPGDDIVAEVLSEVFTKYAHLHDDAQVLVAGGIAKRKLADVYRARAMWLRHAPKLERRAEAYETLGLGANPDAESIERLTRAMRELTDTERTHLNLWARGVPPEELAKLVGKSEGAERTARARLLNRLREQLGQDS
jgi:DNA-directed RNA polymerase specialized sigma24 family protein